MGPTRRKYPSGNEKRKKKQKLEVFIESQRGALDKFFTNNNQIENREIVEDLVNEEEEHPRGDGVEDGNEEDKHPGGEGNVDGNEEEEHPRGEGDGDGNEEDEHPGGEENVDEEQARLNLYDERLRTCCAKLEESLKHDMVSDIDGLDLFSELTVLREVLPKEIDKAIQVLNYLKAMGGCFPNAWVAYRILLTVPVTVASAERSFSKLKLIKSYLRSTMSQERLNGLAMLSIEKDMAKNLDFTSLISNFASQNARRIIFKHFLLRDVYDDMMLDGVQPSRDLFHSLIVGTMKGARLQDAYFFRDQMKAMGLVPDVALYNFLISTCGKCKNHDQAIRIFEEMKRYEVKPTGQTYICLLSACAAAGRIDLVYAIVRDMTAAGLGLNKFCYAGLITAHKNKIPSTDDTASKIVELVEQSKGWSSVEASSDIAENVMIGVSEEELYNIPTSEFVQRRFGFLNRQLTVYHVALHACADLKNIEVPCFKLVCLM